MPEPIASLVAHSSLPASGQVFSETLRLSILPARTIIRLQLGARSQKTAGSLKVAGRSMPTAINSWSGEDPVTMRVGPDTWLFHSAYHEASDLLTAIRSGCGRRSYAATDISDAFVTIAVDGAQAPALFARGCGLDFSMASFGDFACTRTRFAQCPVVLRRVNSERFECMVDRPAAQWLHDWMQDTAVGITE